MNTLQLAVVASVATLINGLLEPIIDQQNNTEAVLPWWKTTIIYQIYPRSFMDTDGDGVGDLNGITSKIDYLKELGVNAVWISPFYVSPMADFGYDISDFVDIDPIFGTLKDFDNLVTELHKRDMKIIMDFVPNHSSDQHEWFQKSINRTNPYTDYYVWVDCLGTDENGLQIPPNNWLSVFKNSAWTWSEERQQFYLHQFLKEQPDLNVRNPAVLNEIKSILRFWMDRGVDGVRADAVKHMFEVEDFSLNEPVAAVPTVDDPTDYNYLDHPYTSNQPETIMATLEWKELLDEYVDKMIMVEIYDNDIKTIMSYYGNETYRIADFPFNFFLITGLGSRSDVTGLKLKSLIDTWLDNMPQDRWPNWVLGNHDRSRVASRLGSDLVDSLNMLILLIQGTPTSYYGDEIGMEDTFVTFEEATDPAGLNYGPDGYTKYGRDPNRSPMQWNICSNAGFSKTQNKTWLPLNDNYQQINVEIQNTADQSHLKVYKALAALRKHTTFTHGEMSFPLITNEFFTILRSFKGEPSYLLVINTSEDPKTANLNELPVNLPETGNVEIRSIFDTRQETAPGCNVSLTNLSLLPSEGIVLRL